MPGTSSQNSVGQKRESGDSQDARYRQAVQAIGQTCPLVDGLADMEVAAQILQTRCRLVSGRHRGQNTSDGRGMNLRAVAAGNAFSDVARLPG